MGAEGALGLLRHEAVDDGSFAFGEHVLDVLSGEILLEDRFAHAESVRTVGGEEVRSEVGLFGFVKLHRFAAYGGDFL